LADEDRAEISLEDGFGVISPALEEEHED